MSTPCITKLIARIPVRPVPLFQDNIDSANSAGSDDDALAVEETMPTQAPEVSGEVFNLALRIGLLDPEGYIDMREPWIEGSRGEKVRRCELCDSEKLADFRSITDCRWCTTQTLFWNPSRLWCYC
jgi:hypothetical protein